MKGNLKKRGEAKVEVAAGAVQEAIGHAVGNEEMEAKGIAHQAAGHTKEKVAKAKERVEGIVDEIAGKAKQVEGKALEIAGKARRAINR